MLEKKSRGFDTRPGQFSTLNNQTKKWAEDADVILVLRGQESYFLAIEKGSPGNKSQRQTLPSSLAESKGGRQIDGQLFLVGTRNIWRPDLFLSNAIACVLK